ncbi:MAG: ribose 5-phosphate isomerase B [Chitinivibrionales bacterium]|nr:ribose 5-phosphate isomerase B [Chitinivibrionales bacterium]MBD3357373.1 ribose 5-phosphate isomerase B [Chitinivibrionales bacterium]
MYFSSIPPPNRKDTKKVSAPEGIIAIGSDHAGFELKEFIKETLTQKGIPYKDMGTDSAGSVDYPLYAGRVARAVSAGTHHRGIAICGAGIGASITANRFRRVRAALCVTVEMARLARGHNDANILVMGGRITPKETASEILEAWLSTPFEGGRHKHRIEMIESVNEEQS